MTDALRFTTSRLFLWMLYFATFAAIYSALPATSLSFAVATLFAVLFVAADLKFNKQFRGLLGISYFACALAYVVAIGLFLMTLSTDIASQTSATILGRPIPFGIGWLYS